MDWDAMAKQSNSRSHTMALQECPPKLAPGAPLPVLFVSHGSPMTAVQDTPVQRFWKILGKQIQELPGLRAILIISAHWETSGTIKVNSTADPATIHDFYGFPDQLYKLKYPAKGSEKVTKRVVQLLGDAGLPIRADSTHGLDHGAWVPLLWMLPDCSVPVVQLSLLADVGGDKHIRVGRALRKLREEGVLIIGSGSSMHNLTDLRRYMGSGKVAPYCDPFEDRLKEILTSQDVDGRDQRLVEFERDPLFRQAHPSAEHFYPLNVAVGAAGREQARRLFEMSEMSIGYTAFAFGHGL